MDQHREQAGASQSCALQLFQRCFRRTAAGHDWLKRDQSRRKWRDKDTLTNIEDTREFVCNMAVWDLRQEMVNTSALLKHGEAESGYVDVEMVPSEMIAPPRVKASPVHLEYKLWKVIDLPADSNSVSSSMIVGQVVGIHIADDVLVDGFIDLAKAKPLARLGYLDYSVVDETFQMRGGTYG